MRSAALGDSNAARAILDEAAAMLERAGVDNTRLDAELMLCAAAHRDRAALLAGSIRLDDAARRRFAASVARRAAREPLAYILGRREFRSIEFEVSPAVLIPRPETETLIEAALEFLSGRARPRVLDIGAGSGAIAIALALNAPDARVVAADISPDALAIAARNADRLGMRERMELRRADCFRPLDSGEALGRFDLIVSNPPYIHTADIDLLQPEIARHEPRLALDGGIDGLDFYRRFAREAPAHLIPGGALMVEIGDGQADAVAELFRAGGFASVRMRKDLAGLPRVIAAGWQAR